MKPEQIHLCMSHRKWQWKRKCLSIRKQMLSQINLVRIYTSSFELPTTELFFLAFSGQENTNFLDRNNVNILKRKRRQWKKTFTNKRLTSVQTAAILTAPSQAVCECSSRAVKDSATAILLHLTCCLQPPLPATTVSLHSSFP